MSQAIYFVANDAVIDQAIALVTSIRVYDPLTPLILIPYDHRYQKVAGVLGHRHAVTVYPDLKLLHEIDLLVASSLWSHRLNRPQRLRHLACWFGPAEHFLYLDTDVVVFQRIVDILERLSDVDFVCCDFQFRSGLRNVFHERGRRSGILPESAYADVFNGGFFASKKQALNWSVLAARLELCGRLRGVLDFSGGACAQPILNYLVLSELPRRINLAKAGTEPGNWAGSPHFRRVGDILYDGSKPLRYLHWAGLSINSDAPYWDVWNHYRNHAST